MTEVAIAIGLILVIEGALYALFPTAMKRLAAQVIQSPGDSLRLAGVIAAAAGVVVVWLVRG